MLAKYSLHATSNLKNIYIIIDIGCDVLRFWDKYAIFYFQALHQIKALNKTVYMTEQSENFISSDFHSLQSDWPVGSKTAATQAAAILDQKTSSRRDCGVDGGGRDFLKIRICWVLVWSWL
jgi:hypothetical protein